jgi:hypothetical protein
MWWFIIGILALIVVVAIVLNRRGSTAAHDLSSDYHPDTSMGGADPNCTRRLTPLRHAGI